MTYLATSPVGLVPPAGRVLKLSGVGFKSFRRGGWVVFQLGYSHYAALAVGSALARPRRGALAVAGDVATQAGRLRRPDPYKARGVYVDGARPPLKEGKRR